MSPPPASADRPLPARGGRRWATRLLAFLTGLAVAAVAHYVLYRIGIAGTPFIYVSF